MAATASTMGNPTRMGSSCSMTGRSVIATSMHTGIMKLSSSCSPWRRNSFASMMAWARSMVRVLARCGSGRKVPAGNVMLAP